MKLRLGQPAVEQEDRDARHAIQDEHRTQGSEWREALGNGSGIPLASAQMAAHSAPVKV
jgi:hypothetical protein